MKDYAVVTGGGRNIGAAICGRLRADGFRVIAVDRIEPEHNDMDEYVELDLSDKERTISVFRTIAERFGPTRLVNNAGIVLPGPLEEFDFDTFGQVMRVNVLRSEEHPSELQSLMRSSYAVFCLKKKKTQKTYTIVHFIYHTTKPKNTHFNNMTINYIHYSITSIQNLHTTQPPIPIPISITHSLYNYKMCVIPN